MQRRMEEQRYLKRKEKALLEGNHDQLAVACNLLGDHYYQEGRHNEAMCEYTQEAKLYEKLKKSLEAGKARRMIGEILMLLADFDGAKENINIYMKTAKQLGNKVEEQRAYATLGRAYLLHGQHLIEISVTDAREQLQQAEKAFLRSLLLIKDITGLVTRREQLDMQARCFLNIGVVKEHMGRFDESLQYIEKGTNIAKSNDLYDLTHLCYTSMGLLYHNKKRDATAALRCINLAYDQAKLLPDKVKKLCETLMIKAEILIKEGDFSSAKHILTKAYKKNTPSASDRAQIEKTLKAVVKICQILDQLVLTNYTDFVVRKGIYEKLGDGCCQLGSYERAIDYYLQMLVCAKSNAEDGKTLVPIYVSLYQTYKDAKDYDRALEYLWKEFELNKDVPTEAFSTLCSIGEVCELQMQSYWTTQDVYRSALEHANKVPMPKRAKLQRIAFVRLKKLQAKHKMHALAADLEKEAKKQGIDLNAEDDDDSDTESVGAGSVMEQNTPDLGSDVCLEDLTDSDASDLDETDKPRAHRTTRGTHALKIKRNIKGETQLHQACINGNVELARRLIDQGLPVNVRDNAGWLPLHEAANHGYYELVALLLDRGATAAINDKGGTKCDGITPLYDACSNGYLDVAELLIARGADVTVRTDFGDNCLQGLDTWRQRTNLRESQQAQYLRVRAALLKPLSKMGISNEDDNQPLTNADASDAPKTDDEDEEAEPMVCGRMHKKLSRTRNSKILKDGNAEKGTRVRVQSAKETYKNVIEQLKRPNRFTVQQQDDDDDDDVEELPHCSKNKSKRSALLDEDEVDVDDWLVDDLAPDKKKRRYHGQQMASTSNSRHSTSKENLHESANGTWDTLDELTLETDAYQLMLDNASTSTRKSKSTKNLSLSRSSSICSNISVATGGAKNNKHQASLLDSGFCRFRSVSPLASEESNVYEAAQDTSLARQQLISPMKVQTVATPCQTQMPPTVHSFKIKVESELLLVPVERKRLNDMNIRSLAEEAARRYNNIVGLQPLLRLKTADGFAYEEKDPVSVAIEQNMILATVLEWKISPLGKRYMEMCAKLNKTPIEAVYEAMERAQVSNTLSLRSFWLRSYQTEPIFMAIMHHRSLSDLDLCDNFIRNEGARQLAKALPTLKQLKVLNLSCNYIQTDGMEDLLNAPNFDKLERLEELIIKFNPLGNTIMRTLDRFCKTGAGRTLKRLDISNIHITNLYEFDLCYHLLTSCNVSFNTLAPESMGRLLSKLNASRLTELNLNFAHTPTLENRYTYIFAEQIAKFFESGSCENFKRIELVGCYLNDSCFQRVVHCLARARYLNFLDISENYELTGSSFATLLQNVPQLGRLNATSCMKLLDMENLDILMASNLKAMPQLVVFTLPEVDNKHYIEAKLLTLWRMHYVKGKVIATTGKVIFYIDDKDLRDS